MLGYNDKVLTIDLATGKTQVKPLDSDIVNKFIGGMGYSSKLISDEVGPNADPLGPDNIIVFATGPLTGTVPCSGRLDVTTKSPLNGLITMGNVGGGLGAALRQSGYDVVIVRNISPEPVYIWIDDGKVEIRKANTLWGKDTQETADRIKAELGETTKQEIRVAAIGPAGENLVRFAALISDYFHAVGKCGIGAVMGSKKLKAIAVRGTRKVSTANPEELKRAGREVADRIRNTWHPSLKAGVPDRYKYDALFIAGGNYEQGVLPIKNYQTTRLPGWMENNTFEQVKKYPVKPKPSCSHCPFSCFWEIEVNEGKYAGLKLAGFEFISSIFNFGGLCGILGLPAIWKCKKVCQKLGMDYWTSGSIVAFAMELYQRGIITKADTGGVALNWGDDDAVLQMLEQIAYRRGVGNIHAEGHAMAARKMGKDAMKYVFTIKGDSMMASDPRQGTLPGVSKFTLFGMLASNRGADNVKTSHGLLDKVPSPEAIRKEFGMSQEEYLSKFVGWLDIFEDEKRQIFGAPPRPLTTTWEGKAAFTKWSADFSTLLSSLTYCIFPWIRGGAVGPTYCARMLAASTGREVTPAQLMKVGERIFNLQRMYLVNCGFSSKDDDFPAKFYDEGVPDGPIKGTRLLREDIDKLRQEYYQLRGWDRIGVPTPEKLRELDLIN